MPGQGAGGNQRDRRERGRRVQAAARRIVQRRNNRDNAAGIFRDYFGGARNGANERREQIVLEDEDMGDFIYVDGDEEEVELDDEELIQLGGGIIGRIGEGNNNNEDDDEDEDDDSEDEDDYDKEEDEEQNQEMLKRGRSEKEQLDSESDVKDEDNNDYDDEEEKAPSHHSSSSSSHSEQIKSEHPSSSSSSDSEEEELRPPILHPPQKVEVKVEASNPLNLDFMFSFPQQRSPPKDNINNDIMALNPFGDIKFEFNADNNPPNNNAWGNQFSQWGNEIGGSPLLSPPVVWGGAAISNPPPAAQRPSRPAEQAISSLYNEILRDQVGLIERRRGVGGLFDHDYHSNIASRKRQRKLEEKRLVRERKSRILRDSIMDKKSGERDPKFVSRGDLRFQTPSVNFVNQKIQEIVKKVYNEIKDPSNKEEAMKQARETVMQAITGQKTPPAADPAVVNKIQDLFNLTKEDAERVIAIRNELQIMDQQIDKKIAEKDKQQSSESRYSLAAASRGRGYGSSNNQEKGKLKNTNITFDQLNDLANKYKQKYQDKIQKAQSTLQELPSSSDEQPQQAANAYGASSSGDQHQSRFLASTEYLERVDLMFAAINKRLDKKF